MAVSKEEVERRIAIFNKYAETLFSMPIAPEQSSMKLAEVDVDSEEQCSILYDLFSYGYRKKVQELTQSNDPYKKQLLQDTHQFFEYIAGFVKASGYEPVLKELEKNEKGELTGIKMSFNKLN